MKMNVFDSLPAKPTEEEIIEIIQQNDNIRIERIISTGQTTPIGNWYDQDTDEWVLLISGDAEIEFENNEKIKLKAGDYIFIPRHKRHRVSYTNLTEPSVWIAVHYNR